MRRSQSVEAASAKGAGKSKGVQARLQKICNLSWKRPAVDRSFGMGLHKKFAVVAGRVSDLESENAMTWKKLKHGQRPHAEAEAMLAKDSR